MILSLGVWRNTASNTSSPLSKSTTESLLTEKKLIMPELTFTGTKNKVPAVSPLKGTSNHYSQSMNTLCPLNLRTLLTKTAKLPTPPNNNLSPTPKHTLHYISPASAGSKALLVHFYNTKERLTTSS